MHFFFSSPPPLPSTFEIILAKSKRKGERERKSETEECLRVQKYNKNKKGGVKLIEGGEKEAGERERQKEPDELLERCAS